MGNRIGTTEDGTRALGNSRYGLLISTSVQTPTAPAASGNTIGGTAPGAGNLISANQVNGIDIVGLNGGGGHNLVQGNFIGTDINGTSSVGNRGNGIEIDNAADNLIGGSAPGARNVISSNRGNGIALFGSGATGNLVQGNFIGTDQTGTLLGSNFANGVLINGAPNTTIGGISSLTLIGGSTTGAGNVISGNAADGIFIEGPGATGTVIQGNLIGTDLTGSVLGFGNLLDGVGIQNASDTIIGGTAPGAGNLISDNRNGITIQTNQSGTVFPANSDATGNLVQGNKIGTSKDGEARLANFNNGIFIFDSPDNIIGGTAPGAGNLISSNEFSGVVLDSTHATGNLVQGNLIGTDAAGINALGNFSFGVDIEFASNNLIGGTTPAAHNLISGNGGAGVRIIGNVLDPTSATGNLIEGNYIGTKASGLGNGPDALKGYFLPFLSNLQGGVQINGAAGNVVGGTDDGAANTISGNQGAGVLITNGSSNNLLEGNDIGPDKTGADVIGNVGSGVVIDLGASNNTIGGTTAAARNIISGNLASGITLQRRLPRLENTPQSQS